jgi:hypothetical protein
VADTAGLGDALVEELSNVYGLRVTPAKKKDKHDAIELFNGDLVDGRIKVLKGSSLEDQLLSLQWAIDDFGKLKESKAQANHSTDAAIYARTAAHHQIKEEAPPARVHHLSDYRKVDTDEEEAERNEEEEGFRSLLSDGDFYGDGFWSDR